MVDAGGVQVGNRDTTGGIAGFEPDAERRRDMLHGDIRDQDVVEQTLGGVPGAGLEEDSGEHVVTVRGAMGVKAGAKEQGVMDRKAAGRADESNAVAGGIDNAPGDDGVIPIPTRDGVVAGVKAAAGDPDIAARAIGSATEMDAVPATEEGHVVDVHFVADQEQDGVVGGIEEGEVADGEAPAIDEHEGVGAAHFLLAVGVEDAVAVDASRAGEGDVFEVFADDEAAMPFAPAGFGQCGGRGGLLVMGEVGAADERGAGVEIERHMALEMDRAGEITARGEKDLTTAGFGAGVDGGVDGAGVRFEAVAEGAVVADIEHSGSRGKAGDGQQQGGGRGDDAAQGPTGGQWDDGHGCDVVRGIRTVRAIGLFSAIDA